MTLRLTHPIALEPERAAAHARYRTAISGQRRRAWEEFRDKTTAELRKTEDKRDG